MVGINVSIVGTPSVDITGVFFDISQALDKVLFLYKLESYRVK